MTDEAISPTPVKQPPQGCIILQVAVLLWQCCRWQYQYRMCQCLYVAILQVAVLLYVSVLHVAMLRIVLGRDAVRVVTSAVAMSLNMCRICPLLYGCVSERM